MLSWTDLNIVKMFVILERIYIIYTPTCLWLYSVNTHKHTHTFTLLCLQREDTLVLFSAMLYECVTQECPEMLPTYIAIEQVTQTHQHTLSELGDDTVELVLLTLTYAYVTVLAFVL